MKYLSISYKANPMDVEAVKRIFPDHVTYPEGIEHDLIVVPPADSKRGNDYVYVGKGNSKEIREAIMRRLIVYVYYCGKIIPINRVTGQNKDDWQRNYAKVTFEPPRKPKLKLYAI